MSSLLPGYKHVTEFSSDEQYEGEEEVCYITLDLGPNVDKALLPNTSEYRLAGLDTATPMLQLSGTFFKGRHEELIGSEILFKDGRDESNPSRRFVVPVGTTEQRIGFEQVSVMPKLVQSRQSPTTSNSNLDLDVTVNPSKSSRGRGGRRSRKGKERELPHKEPYEQIIEFGTNNDNEGVS